MKKLSILFLLLLGACVSEPEVRTTQTKPVTINKRSSGPVIQSFQCPDDASWQYFEGFSVVSQFEFS